MRILVTLSSPLIGLQVVPMVETDNIPHTHTHRVDLFSCPHPHSELLGMAEMCEGVGDGAEGVVEDRDEGSE